MIDMQPPRGAFDYLLDPIRDQLQPPPPPRERGGGGSPPRVRIEIEITERRPVKRRPGLGLIGWLLFGLGLLAWSLIA